MIENIRVTCLLDRYWDPSSQSYKGTEQNGDLIEICMQSSDSDSGKLIAVGIVLLDNNTFQSVPLDFITKIKAN